MLHDQCLHAHCTIIGAVDRTSAQPQFKLRFTQQFRWWKGIQYCTVHPCFNIVDCGRGATPTSTRKGKVGRKRNQRKRIAFWKRTERNHLQEMQEIGREEENQKTSTAGERLEMDEAREGMGEGEQPTLILSGSFAPL
jgi:hypothetical protein